MEENFVKLIKRISEDYEDNKYMNYIKYIQFPKYKNLTDGSRIEFNFPLTMLVGKWYGKEFSITGYIWLPAE